LSKVRERKGKGNGRQVNEDKINKDNKDRTRGGRMEQRQGKGIQ
jgi:hypothetical protein